METKYDYLIVGTGLYGSVFAYLAGQAGKSCLMVEKRNTVGGNLYCEEIEGIHVHSYGPHVFHTSNKKVWDFVNGLVPFKNFILSPMANYCGKLYNLPFNMNTFYQMWGIKDPVIVKTIIDKQRYDGPIANLEEQALSLVGKDIYEKLIKGYTEKQWGRKCTELPPFIIKRLPVRLTYNNNYFNDEYQGIPVGGYNKLIEALTEKADIINGQDYIQNRDYFNGFANKVIYTGKIDEYFDYSLGELQYRSVFFKTDIIDTPNMQGVATINYTDANTPWTRIIEHKHFECFGDDIYKNPKTVISKEFSQEWTRGTEGYYPINDERNEKLYKKYRKLADREKNVIFGGRLADYRYYDMDDTVEMAMKTVENELNVSLL